MTAGVSAAEFADTRVGIVIVSHQQEYLTDCLQSVLAQSFLQTEALLVDNASPGAASASEMAERLGIDSVRLDKAKSLATARNVGCEILDDCEYLVTLDGDDLLHPDFVAVFLQAAIQHGADVVYGPAELFGAMSGIAFEPKGRRDLRRGNFIPATSLFSRRIWRVAGGFDPQLSYFEDWDFWLSCAEQGARFHAVSDVLWRYRRHATSMLATADESEKARSRRYIREKHLRYIWGRFQWRRLRRDIAKALHLER